MIIYLSAISLARIIIIFRIKELLMVNQLSGNTRWLYNSVRIATAVWLLLFAVRLGLKTLTWGFCALKGFCYGLLIYLKYKCPIVIFYI